MNRPAIRYRPPEAALKLIREHGLTPNDVSRLTGTNVQQIKSWLEAESNSKASKWAVSAHQPEKLK